MSEHLSTLDSPLDGSIVDDTAAQVSYFPAGAWRTNTRSTHYNRTYHLTNVPRAYMTFRFNGSFVAYCSNVADDHGDFFVSVDGRPVGTRSAYAESLLPTKPLFIVSVEPGPHVLNISNAAAHTVMSLDYFITSSATSAVSLSAPSTSARPPRSSSSRHPSSASKPVAYAVLGLLCALVAASLLWAARRCARTSVGTHPPGPTSSSRPDPPPYSLTVRHS